MSWARVLCGILTSAHTNYLRSKSCARLSAHATAPLNVVMQLRHSHAWLGWALLVLPYASRAWPAGVGACICGSSLFHPSTGVAAEWSLNCSRASLPHRHLSSGARVTRVVLVKRIPHGGLLEQRHELILADPAVSIGVCLPQHSPCLHDTRQCIGPA